MMNAKQQLLHKLEVKEADLKEINQEIDDLWLQRQRQFGKVEEKSNEEHVQYLENQKNKIETEINHLLRQLEQLDTPPNSPTRPGTPETQPQSPHNIRF